MADKVQNDDRSYRPPVNRPDRVDRGSRILTPGGKDVKDKSPFQKLLDEKAQRESYSSSNSGDSGESGATREPTGTQTQDAVRPAASYQERYGRDKQSFEKKFAEKEKERDDGKSNRSESVGPRAKEAEQRVVSRSSVSEHKHGGQGEGGKHGGTGGQGQGKKGKGFESSMQMGTGRKELGKKPGSGTFQLEGKPQSPAMAAALKNGKIGTGPAEAAKTPNGVMSKALLDQLVQYCRLVTKTDGDKEMDLQLHEEVFKGLRLRLSEVHGKIEATFMTTSKEVSDLFQAQKADLKQALAEKGIDVRSINVIII